MTEYIFHPANSFGWKPGEYERENNMDHYGTLHDEIVRCRDCEFEMNGYCSQPDEWHDDLWFPVEPNGFCAWGERKKVSE